MRNSTSAMVDVPAGGVESDLSAADLLDNLDTDKPLDRHLR
jgi:hypothetical protein